MGGEALAVADAALPFSVGTADGEALAVADAAVLPSPVDPADGEALDLVVGGTQTFIDASTLGGVVCFTWARSCASIFVKSKLTNSLDTADEEALDSVASSPGGVVCCASAR